MPAKTRFFLLFVPKTWYNRAVFFPRVIFSCLFCKASFFISAERRFSPFGYHRPPGRRISLTSTAGSNTVDLIDDGNTIPLLPDTVKEMTGSLTTSFLRELSERLEYLRGLEKRKEEVRSSIESQGKLDESLAQAISSAVTLTEVEDLYRPF